MHEVYQSNENEVVIMPTSQWGRNFSGLWEFRGLLYWLAWRDVKGRYRQTYVGAFWALLQPLSMMLVITLALGILAKVPSEGLPFSVFVMTGLVPWILFTSIMNLVSISLVSNGALISKIYFPRLVIPFSTSVVPVIDCFVTIVFFILLSLCFGCIPKATCVFAIFFVILCYILAMGLGLWCAALNTRSRDIQYFVPLILQIGLYASPVMYPLRLVPEKWRLLYSLNPMVSILEGFRWAFYDIGIITPMMLSTSIITTLVIFGSGFLYFQTIERTLVDTL